MRSTVLTSVGPMKCHSIRLRRGEDLLLSIRELAAKEHIQAAVVLSAVGCISRGRVRDASGVNIQEIEDHCEILSLNGTISARRCHLHIALSREDLSAIGGHLVPGCIINTTCELVLVEVPNVTIDTEDDPETGYDELIFREDSK